ncbi:TIGR02530 family flagellar biosynthesis protein [Oscillospiraceae bacterium MB08-C2-2]|nr:TIGR02530 family flagellar biosynthesis protein [Oscillospiraceae bacterium MB08-C2-2]
MSQFIQGLPYAVTTGRIQPVTRPVSTPAASKTTGTSFEELLRQQLEKQEGLTLSKHAKARVEQRDISLSQADMLRLEGAVETAEKKGLTDTLVLMDSTAFIINVPSRVVVTVVGQNDRQENVFTNIDGAVIL